MKGYRPLYRGVKGLFHSTADVLKGFITFKYPESRRPAPVHPVYGYGVFLSIASVSFLFLHSNISTEAPLIPRPDLKDGILEIIPARVDMTEDPLERPGFEEFFFRKSEEKNVKQSEPAADERDLGAVKAGHAGSALINNEGDLLGKIALKEDTPFERPERVRTPPDITRGSPESMELAVTFDGGSDGREAGEILKILRERSIKTTVFITGSFIKKYPGLVWMIVRDGHEVGNHTMNHPHLTSYAIDYTHTTLPGIDRELIARELKDTAVLFKEVTGVEMAPIWRAPYGEVNGEIRRWAFEQGYVHIGWTMNYSTKESLDSLDWVSDKSSELYLTSKEIKYKLLDFEKGGTGLRGGIILMHLGTKRNGDRLSDRLGEILDAISERGYRFVKVSTLIKGNKIKPFGKKHLASTRPWSPINRIRE